MFSLFRTYMSYNARRCALIYNEKPTRARDHRMPFFLLCDRQKRYRKDHDDALQDASYTAHLGAVSRNGVKAPSSFRHPVPTPGYEG